MQKLKPCPFCGSPAELTFKIPVSGAGGCEIECTMCYARVNDFKYVECRLDEETGTLSALITLESISKCIERAINAWNRRANEGGQRRKVITRKTEPSPVI